MFCGDLEARALQAAAACCPVPPAWWHCPIRVTMLSLLMAKRRCLPAPARLQKGIIPHGQAAASGLLDECYGGAGWCGSTGRLHSCLPPSSRHLLSCSCAWCRPGKPCAALRCAVLRCSAPPADLIEQLAGSAEDMSPEMREILGQLEQYRWGCTSCLHCTTAAYNTGCKMFCRSLCTSALSQRVACLLHLPLLHLRWTQPAACPHIGHRHELEGMLRRQRTHEELREVQEKLDAVDDERQAHAGIFAHHAAEAGACLQFQQPLVGHVAGEEAGCCAWHDVCQPSLPRHPGSLCSSVPCHLARVPAC